MAIGTHPSNIKTFFYTKWGDNKKKMRSMDVSNILIGVSLILVSKIIFINQNWEGVYKKKEGATIGDKN